MRTRPLGTIIICLLFFICLSHKHESITVKARYTRTDTTKDYFLEKKTTITIHENLHPSSSKKSLPTLAPPASRPSMEVP